ncbi:hypothetical protein PILCRDRAFT_813600, partial [Piloderma croceum F 1598]
IVPEIDENAPVSKLDVVGLTADGDRPMTEGRRIGFVEAVIVCSPILDTSCFGVGLTFTLGFRF